MTYRVTSLRPRLAFVRCVDWYTMAWAIRRRCSSARSLPSAFGKRSAAAPKAWSDQAVEPAIFRQLYTPAWSMSCATSSRFSTRSALLVAVVSVDVDRTGNVISPSSSLLGLLRARNGHRGSLSGLRYLLGGLGRGLPHLDEPSHRLAESVLRSLSHGPSSLLRRGEAGENLDLPRIVAEPRQVRTVLRLGHQAGSERRAHLRLGELRARALSLDVPHGEQLGEGLPAGAEGRERRARLVLGDAALDVQGAQAVDRGVAVGEVPLMVGDRKKQVGLVGVVAERDEARGRLVGPHEALAVGRDHLGLHQVLLGSELSARRLLNHRAGRVDGHAGLLQLLHAPVLGPR